jgi:hypothetical protein
MNRKEGIELRGRWGVGDAGVRGGSSSVASIRGQSQVVQIWPSYAGVILSHFDGEQVPNYTDQVRDLRDHYCHCLRSAHSKQSS